MIKRHLTTILVAMVTAAVTAAAPSLAAAFDALNAHKVDGKHAVGSGASATQRKGKLVATNKKGKLPNNIIAKAPDAVKADKATNANKLDNLDSSEFMKADDAEFTSNSATMADDASDVTIMSWPGAVLKGTCAAGAPDTFVDLTEDWDEGWVESNGAGTAFDPSVGSGGTVTGTGANPLHHEYQLSRHSLGGFGRVTTFDVFGSADGSACHFAGTSTDRNFSTFNIILP